MEKNPMMDVAGMFMWAAFTAITYVLSARIERGADIGPLVATWILLAAPCVAIAVRVRASGKLPAVGTAAPLLGLAVLFGTAATFLPMLGAWTKRMDGRGWVTTTGAIVVLLVALAAAIALATSVWSFHAATD